MEFLAMQNNSSSVKEKHFTLRLALAIAVAFLALALAVLHPSATEDVTPITEKPRIVAVSLSLNDTIYINYAVNVPKGADGFGLLVWEGEAPFVYAHDERAVDITVSEGQTTVEGTATEVLVYRGLAIKEFSDDVFAVPYVLSAGQYVYGEPLKYSVLQYADAKKGNEDLRPVIDALLDFGAEAQIYFNYNTDRLANSEFVKVNVHGASLPDGTEHGMFEVGKETIPAPKADGRLFAGWYSDEALTQKIDVVDAAVTDAYAKWVDPIVDVDFSASRAPSTEYREMDGVRFNVGNTATTSTAVDENGIPYLSYTNGSETGIVSNLAASAPTTLAKLSGTDVFSYRFGLRKEDEKSILTTSRFALRAEKKGAYKESYVQLIDIASDGTVTSKNGTVIADLSTGEISYINIAVNFADGTISYYGDDGIITTETFKSPTTAANTTKAWQSLMTSYLFDVYFDGGNALRFYEILVCEGNVFA